MAAAKAGRLDLPLTLSDVARLLNRRRDDDEQAPRWTRRRVWRLLRRIDAASGGKVLSQPGGAGSRSPLVVTMARLREVIPGFAERLASAHDVTELQEEVAAQAAEIATMHRQRRDDRARIAALERAVARLTEDRSSVGKRGAA